jgi:drug/metabolite transporter (DMT)-like permease
MSKNEIRGYLYILIGATLWGVSSVVAKSLLSSDFLLSIFRDFEPGIPILFHLYT